MSIDIPNLESFLFTEQKEDYLKKLVAGTDYYYYFTLTNALNKFGLDIPQEYQSLLDQYKQFNNNQSKSIELRYLLLKLESAKTDQERNTIMSEINKKYLHYDFTHTQPTRATGVSLMGGQEQVVSDSLERELLSYKTLLKVDDLEYKINSIDEYLLSELDLSQLEHAAKHIQDSFLSKINTSISVMKGVPQFLNSYYNKNKNLQENILSNLTTQQINELVTLIPNIVLDSNFFQFYLVKNFSLDFKLAEKFNGLFAFEKMEEKKKILLQILQFLRKLQFRRLKIEEQILKGLLVLGLQSNEYDFDLFIQYVKEPSFNYTNFNEKHINAYKQRNQQLNSDSVDSFSEVLTIFFGLKIDIIEQQIIEKFSIKYIQLKETYDILIPYFSEKYLKKTLLKIQLQKGKSIEKITENFTSEEIKAITDKKCIKICNYNKQLFRSNEEVSIDVILKNIPQLTVKLFEINTENYYKKNLKELDNNIELDGLIASEETSFEFKNPPVQKFTQSFKFENISKKSSGIFVIEFIGNGVSSRAIIRKGCLVLRQKKTVAGLACQILDQNLQLCEGPNTGIFFQKKYYPLNSDKEVIIPFTDTQINDKAILIHNDFSSITDLQTLIEDYSFDCAYIYNTQSMLMSSKAKILIQPRLYFNKQHAPLTMLKESKVIVTTVNAMGIPSSTTFNKIEFDSKTEVEIEFPVSAKIASISIQVETSLKTMTKGNQTQSSSHSITFSTHENQTHFCIQNLRYTTSGYEIYLVGQNGEPKPNIDLDLSFQLRGYCKSIPVTLKTNSEGFVKLYELENVLKITSNVKQQGDIYADSKTWFIDNSNQINYQTDVKITPNDKIKLPYHKNVLDQNLNFVSVLFQFEDRVCVLNDEIQRVKVENFTILIDALPVGSYKLVIRDIPEAIQIEVVEGKYWNETHSIQTQKGLIDQKRNAHFLVIQNVQVETPDENSTGNTLNIKLFSDHKDLVRAHVIAYHYLPSDVNAIVEDLNKLVELPESNFINLTKQLKANIYQSNKSIGDEIRYALERKRHQRYIGNTLDKPHLLLKRTFVRDTNYENEQLNRGGTYSPRAKSADPYEQFSDMLMDRALKGKLGKSGKDGLGAHFGQNYVDCYNNYLLNPALVISNLKPDENGVIRVKNLNLSKYSTLQVIATDLYNNITKVVPLDKNVIQTRNLCQRVNQQKDKFFTISRTNEYILKGSEFKSEDFTSTELQLVDSIPKLFSAQKELRKIHGSDTEQTNGYDFWEFLVKWTTYTLEEKHKKYDQFSCHELNLFIFCKDPPFFQDFVRPFIQNKIEKTFIDYFLINDSKYLLQNVSASSISDLNALETVLLIFFLKQNNMVDEAKSVFNFLESSNKIKKYDTSHFKKLFDTVLNAKQEGQTENELQQMFIPQNISANMNMQQFMPSQNINMMANQAPIQQNFYFGGAPGGFYGARMSQALPQQMYQYQQQQQQQLNYQPHIPNPAPQARFARQHQQEARRAPMQNQSNLVEMDCFSYGEKAYQQFDDFGDNYQNKRSGFIQQYQNVETTKEYCERHYYSQKELQPQTNLVPINNFWIDLARHIITYGQEKPFLSSNFIYCSSNHTQMITSLAFLALPFESQSHNYEPYEGKGIKITMNSNCIVFAKQIKEGQAQLREDILITQKFFDPNDRYVFSDENPDDKYEKQITEYVVDKRYGCQVIVTNCSAARHELQVFVEIPSGSIPVYTSDYTKTHNIILEPFQTKPIEYFFYFPQAGHQDIYPANVAKSGQIVAFAKPCTFDVKEKRTVSNLETMNEILQKGSKDDILKFVQTKNILNTNIFQFNEIYYLLKDKSFYQKFVEILKNRKVFDTISWAYSIYHGDYSTFLEFIKSPSISASFENHLYYFHTNSLSIDKNRFYEYYPLSNPRVHMLHSDKSNILNSQFKQRYNSFLNYLSQKPKWEVSDKLGLVYYFLLQDRIEEAINIYKKIDQTAVAQSPNCQLQYDYFTTYLDFFIGFPNFKKARELCEKYLDYPVFQWRNLFYEVANKLAEYDGEEEQIQEPQADQSEEQQKQLKIKNANKKKEEMNETLKVNLAQTTLDITIQNISKLTITYYLIDLEILFSRNPFLSKEASDFSFVKPNHLEVFDFDISKGLQKVQIPIPEKYVKSNVCIEVSSHNVQSSVTYFSTSLQVQIIEDIGQIKILDKEEKPLSKVYVKCFSKQKDGTVSFFKDGYTDLVGRFDYVSRSSTSNSNIQKFSIFVMSDELGAIIKEANPPSQVGEIVEQVRLKGAAWNARADNKTKQQVQSYATHQSVQKACKNAFF
ncbi:hypothetical protein ABPG72_004273 [Tetrahymena utriculariae]